jgi:hypothetical protein
VTDHGSTANTSAPIIDAPAAPPDPRPPRRRRARAALRRAIDPDNPAEVSRPPGLDAGQRVLEHRRLRRLGAERPGAGQKGVRRRLAGQALALGHHPVDARLEQMLDAGGGQHVLAVGAGGHHRGAQPLIARLLDEAD